MKPLDLVRLPPLMALTEGTPQIDVALLDGPVLRENSELAIENMHRLQAKPGLFEPSHGAASRHGTFIAGILAARRGRTAPAICPNCTFLIRPVFADASAGDQHPLGTTVDELASAILESINAGARIINLSVGSTYPSTARQPRLRAVLDYAAERGVLIVAAAGNQGTLGTSVLTRHPWVLPVAAVNLDGRPSGHTNLAHALGKRGVSGPGEKIMSLGINGDLSPTSGGTSVAAAFVTGAAALLWSLFPSADAADIKNAVLGGRGTHRSSVVPPLLDAWGAYSLLLETRSRRAS
ncbi:S8 family serine peptidase [Streptomyces sp. NPDC016469]|uniref:S8 family serine peptidase n=1 Tax=Streptomyces sp. NPDC016469 TaxID=3157191 RepID=UPI00340143E2